MDLSTTYMGLKLKSPIVHSSSPLSRDIGAIRQLEDAGAAAVVLYSLFGEQLKYEAEELSYYLDRGTEAFPESLTYFPDAATVYHTGPEAYLEHIARAKKAVGIPIVASLNASTLDAWTEYARQIEQAGADALEINLYQLAAEVEQTGAQVEKLHLDVLKRVKRSVGIPVAMKLSPYFSSLANMAARLDGAGADALVLFNRFYQPVIDPQELEVRPDLTLSTPVESRLPVRWTAILFGRLKADLAVTSGIHDAVGVVQALLAGAAAVYVCSAVLAGGPGKIRELTDGLTRWLEAHEYASVGEVRGILSQKSCPDPRAFERANYMKTLAAFQYPGSPNV